MFKVTYFIVFAIGCCLGAGVIHFWGSNFDLGDEINIVDLSSVLTTLFLAFYIPTVLEKNRDSKKFVKEIIIKRVDALQQNFDSISSSVSSCDTSIPVVQDTKSDILGKFTRISNDLKVLEQIFDEIKAKQIIKDYIGKINTLRRRYKNHVTGGRFDLNSFVYTGTAKIQESVLATEVTKELSFLILKINALQ